MAKAQVACACSSEKRAALSSRLGSVANHGHECMGMNVKKNKPKTSSEFIEKNKQKTQALQPQDKNSSVMMICLAAVCWFSVCQWRDECGFHVNFFFDTAEGLTLSFCVATNPKMLRDRLHPKDLRKHGDGCLGHRKLAARGIVSHLKKRSIHNQRNEGTNAHSHCRGYCHKKQQTSYSFMLIRCRCMCNFLRA
jgi:hypothetical protein